MLNEMMIAVLNEMILDVDYNDDVCMFMTTFNEMWATMLNEKC
jgi:hypothetical protein